VQAPAPPVNHSRSGEEQRNNIQTSETIPPKQQRAKGRQYQSERSNSVPVSGEDKKTDPTCDHVDRESVIMDVNFIQQSWCEKKIKVHMGGEGNSHHVMGSVRGVEK